MEKASDKHGPRVKVRTDGPMMSSTCLACRMFLTGVNTLSQLRLDLLGGLCCGELLLPRLWHLITDLGPQCGLKSFTDLLVMSPSDTSHPLFALLQLACDTAVHIITYVIICLQPYLPNRDFVFNLFYQPIKLVLLETKIFKCFVSN